MATTTSDALDGLLCIRDGSFEARWNFPDAVGSSPSAPAGIGNTTNISYSFLTAIPSYYTSTSISDFLAFATDQKQATENVLACIEELANISFSGTTGIGQMTFASTSQSAGQGGYAYMPNYSYSHSGSTILSVTELGNGGDVWINRNIAWTARDWVPGHDGYVTLLHEIGHALGLKHPFEASSNGYFLDAALNNESHTVMSYTLAPKSTLIAVTGTSTGYWWQTSYLRPSTLMPLDIEAIQYLYGANLTTRTGNDTYKWTLNPEVLETIWDAGGSDTIDCSNQTLTCIINLQDGSYSSISLRQTDTEKRLGLDIPDWFAPALPTDIYDGSNNIAIAKGSIIEHAKGGSADDRLYGNATGNLMTGGGGNDSIFGYAGNDTLDGGTGNDSMAGNTGNDYYYVRENGDVVTEAAGEGSDTVYSYLTSYTLGSNIENARIMNTGSASLSGNNHNNFLYAGAGNNVINGGSGTDSLSYYYGNNGTGITVSLAIMVAQTTGGSGSDTLSSIESLYGTNYADKFTGNNEVNYLRGYNGNDTLDGGAGNDIMVGNLGNDYYYVRDNGDVVTEAVSEGTDTVYSYLNTYTLGNNVENSRIMNTGAASLTGNSLNNIIYAGTGDNIITGEGGTDTLSYAYGLTSNSTSGITVSLACTTAQNTGSSGSDLLSGFENLIGSSKNDKLTGSAGNNVLNGSYGNDSLFGGDGNDTLIGGVGNDMLASGSGKDVFDFDSLSEMGTSSATWDIISDFVRGQDKIDLSTLDANTATTTNDAFSVTLIGSAANFTTAGQLKLASGVLYGNTDADADAEFAIALTGITALSATDFIL